MTSTRVGPLSLSLFLSSPLLSSHQRTALSSPGRVAPLAVVTSTFDEISSSGDVHFIYDDDKMAIASVLVVVTINGNTAFSDSLSVGTFSYSFGTSTLNQIKNAAN